MSSLIQAQTPLKISYPFNVIGKGETVKFLDETRAFVNINQAACDNEMAEAKQYGIVRAKGGTAAFTAMIHNHRSFK